MASATSPIVSYMSGIGVKVDTEVEDVRRPSFVGDVLCGGAVRSASSFRLPPADDRRNRRLVSDRSDTTEAVELIRDVGECRRSLLS
jgi:hypothetical protein